MKLLTTRKHFCLDFHISGNGNHCTARVLSSVRPVRPLSSSTRDISVALKQCRFCIWVTGTCYFYCTKCRATRCLLVLDRTCASHSRQGFQCDTFELSTTPYWKSLAIEQNTSLKSVPKRERLRQGQNQQKCIPLTGPALHVSVAASVGRRATREGEMCIHLQQRSSSKRRHIFPPASQAESSVLLLRSSNTVLCSILWPTQILSHYSIPQTLCFMHH